MQELEQFFRGISSKEREDNNFMENILFVGVSEWHLTPNELLDIDIPMLFILLNKRKESFKTK